MTERIERGWHFLRSDGALGYGDGRIPADGEWVRAKPDEHHEVPVLCEHGMHASRRLIDALDYAPGPMLCRVEVRGNIVLGDDKLAGMERRILWRIDGENVLRDFARRCALDVVHLWDAPDVVVRYLKTGDPDLRAAAWAAAWAAARAAARAVQSRRLTSMVIAEAKRQGVYR